MKTKKGISLIVLIVTIIVIIILASVVILSLNKNNPIKIARQARFESDVNQFKEELNMAHANKYMNDPTYNTEKVNVPVGDYNTLKEYIPSLTLGYSQKLGIRDGQLIYFDSLNGNSDKDEIEWAIDLKIWIGKNVPEEWANTIGFLTSDNVPIPKGFSYLTGTKESGTVIKDTDGNEFVWIPVDGVNLKYEKFTTINGDSPDVDDTLPIGISNENSDVTKYGGFYIGRYEATEAKTGKIPTCIKGRTVWSKISYSDAKLNAESMYTGDNSSVQSGLLTGKAWDTTCKWIEDYVVSIAQGASLSDSRSYGNYGNSIFPANVTGAGEKQVAGFSDKWCVKNIYDLAGNVWEWTSEKIAGSPRNIERGGCYLNSDYRCGVSYRAMAISEMHVTQGFRVRLYIK